MSAKNTLRSLGLAAAISTQACGPSITGASALNSMRARSAQCEKDDNSVEGIMAEIICEFGKTSEGLDKTSAAACSVADTEQESINKAQDKINVMIEGLCPEGQKANFLDPDTASTGMATKRAVGASTVFGHGTEYHDTGFVTCRYIGFGDGYECKPAK